MVYSHESFLVSTPCHSHSPHSTQTPHPPLCQRSSGGFKVADSSGKGHTASMDMRFYDQPALVRILAASLFHPLRCTETLGGFWLMKRAKLNGLSSLVHQKEREMVEKLVTDDGAPATTPFRRVNHTFL
ncbi:hypothetical protein M8C21_021246 [Ambrosia artemisiifolia]|uniref:Uncharacterized protein n=1 Tax=Ambrosia artemisiifolia TaxID=4212 RepID=A0AAD5G4E0_AMBAR|nr:hypothetical protein M8C21_021246 [Ambrosia artemisiifolia]